MSAGSSLLIATLGTYTDWLFEFDTARVGVMFGVFGFVGALAQGGIRPAVARMGEEPLCVIGLALLSLGCVGLAVQPGLPGFWATLAIIALGTATATTCLSALLSNRVTADLQGRLMGLQQSVTGLGRTLGFGLAGAALAIGPSGPGALSAALSLLAVTALLTLPRRRVSESVDGEHVDG